MDIIKNEPYMPTEIEINKISKTEATISAYPFETGYAITLAHPLRRLLMASTVGYAPIAIKIDGVSHEFDSVKGMLENISKFILNLKNVRFKIKDGSDECEVEYLFEGNQEIKGSDLSNEKVEIVTGDSHIAILNDDCTLNFSLLLRKGIGYIPSEELKIDIPDGYIPLDAFFTPIKKAIYKIENVLVEDNPNFEKIVFQIVTDGQIEPEDAFKEALTNMQKQLSIFNKIFDLNEEEATGTQDFPELKDLTSSVDELELSARSFNCLKRANLEYLGELVLMSEVEVKSIKNLGKKSFDEVSEKLAEKGYPISQVLPENLASALRRTLEELKA
jgi:DNA-directed RNA polymerase subunit alpha